MVLRLYLAHVLKNIVNEVSLCTSTKLFKLKDNKYGHIYRSADERYVLRITDLNLFEFIAYNVDGSVLERVASDDVYYFTTSVAYIINTTKFNT